MIDKSDKMNLPSPYYRLLQELTKLISDHNILKNNYKKLSEAYEVLQEDYKKLEKDL